MNTTAWLAAARAQQNALMASTCTITDPAGSGWAWNGTAEAYTPGPLVYTGPCSVLPARVAERATDAGGQQVTTASMIVKIPADAPRIFEGHRVVWNGRALTVAAAPDSDLLTCRRLVCTDSQEAPGG